MSVNKVDILNRSPFVDDIVQICNTISSNNGNTTFSINGTWGSGKSFVLDMIKEKLKYMSGGSRYLLVDYNCWQYDFYEEPLVSICSVLLDAIREYKHFPETEKKEGYILALNVALRVIGKAIENKTGVNITEVANDAMSDTESDIKDDIEFDTYLALKSKIDEIRDNLKKISKNRTIVIVVDELDRCIPTYAVKVLERLHHIFTGIPNLIVIVAIDKSQIENTIRQLFGQNANATKYLKKFITFEYSLTNNNIQDNFSLKYSEYINLFDKSIYSSELDFDMFAKVLFANIDIRIVEQLMDKVILVHDCLFKNHRLDESFMYFEILYAVISGHYKVAIENLFNYSVKNRKQMIDVDSNIPNDIRSYLLSEWVVPTDLLSGTTMGVVFVNDGLRENILHYCKALVTVKSDNYIGYNQHSAHNSVHISSHTNYAKDFMTMYDKLNTI